MLVSFSIGNYLSFKDIQTIDLNADSLKEFQTNLHIPYFYNKDERLLKSLAIYGHNSHGKSNIIKAFQFLHHLIFTSFSNGQLTNSIELDGFRLNTSMKGKPSFFELVFLIRDTKYKYRLLATSSNIIQEELYYSQAKIRDNYLFERRDREIKYSKQWNKENNNRIEGLAQFAKPHILFLSVLLSQENITSITDIGKWLGNNIVVPDIYINELKKAQSIYSNPDYTNLILKFISAADLGFTSIFDKLDRLNKSKPSLDKGLLNIAFDREIRDFELYTNHTVYNKDHEMVDKIEFELLKNESAGSIKYFIIVCLLAYAIKNSQLIWIDELDARFHSLLLEMLITSFHNPDINPINSQLVFTTHNTHLLDKKLRRDQVIVVEKNEWGESTIKKAHTIENPVRIGKSLEKEYRKGKIGGVSKKIQDNLGPTLFD